MFRSYTLVQQPFIFTHSTLPVPYYTVRDQKTGVNVPVIDSQKLILEKYFNDLFQVFLVQFSALPIKNALTKKEKDNLFSLLEEIVNVKNLLEK